jgi:ubiquinone/menaquinone biosynthesis C-methylase UbiE
MVDGGGADPHAARVAAQYERWPFPQEHFLTGEGLLLLRRLRAWLDPSGAQDGRPARLIDVGCGTGETTLAVARHFPGAEITGIDISAASLRMAAAGAVAAGIDNVRFTRASLLGNVTPFGSHDVVICTGVLHHIRSMSRAFGNLVRLASPGGHLALWFYGRHGRAPHSLNQAFLRMITRGQSSSAAAVVVRAFLDALGPRFVIGSGFYTPKGCGPEGLAWLRAHPAWIEDQMTPAFERRVELGEILDLFDRHGVAFEEWLGVPTRMEDYTDNESLIDSFARLSLRQRLEALDCLVKPPHYFVIGTRRVDARHEQRANRTTSVT